jgi:hypothetical protein
MDAGSTPNKERATKVLSASKTCQLPSFLYKLEGRQGGFDGSLFID